MDLTEFMQQEETGCSYAVVGSRLWIRAQASHGQPSGVVSVTAESGRLDSRNAGARRTLIKSPGDARHVLSHLPGMSGIMH